MNLVETVYKITSEFPKEETYGLRSQLRRAVVSVPSNIAEGIAGPEAASSPTFYPWLMVRLVKWKRRSKWRDGWDTLQTSSKRAYSKVPRRWDELWLES